MALTIVPWTIQKINQRLKAKGNQYRLTTFVVDYVYGLGIFVTEIEKENT